MMDYAYLSERSPSEATLESGLVGDSGGLVTPVGECGEKRLASLRSERERGELLPLEAPERAWDPIVGQGPGVSFARCCRMGERGRSSHACSGECGEESSLGHAIAVALSSTRSSASSGSHVPENPEEAPVSGLKGESSGSMRRLVCPWLGPVKPGREEEEEEEREEKREDEEARSIDSGDQVLATLRSVPARSTPQVLHNDSEDSDDNGRMVVEFAEGGLEVTPIGLDEMRATEEPLLLFMTCFWFRACVPN
ncbi:hypothetical protein RHMOL_Rhmol11G0009100 [Rhododendron molle]|nr:hypothetical protein RHMOL_Rhmol11G0009100 [Rhododendron molle]